MTQSISPQSVKAVCETDNVAVVDVRAISAVKQGVITGVLVMSAKDVIEQASQLQDQYNKIYIVCQNGEQSAQLCELLGESFISVEGGMDLWKSQGLPLDRTCLDALQTRYQQQINLPGFGLTSQKKLAQSHVAVVGAGGLGAPALLYLVAAGVGNLTIIDDDHVVLSNLQRQILYTEQDVNQAKSNCAQSKLRTMNKTVNIRAYQQRLDDDNVADLLAQADLVVDGSDNFQTRYLINQYCITHEMPWVFAAVSGYELQVGVFDTTKQECCFECMFPPVDTGSANDCQLSGVLGTVTGMAAMLQVTEVIKVLARLEGQLQGHLINYNVMTHQFKMLKYPPQSNCPHR